ncbi:hypothetical protein D9M70_602310 [compost metagenome]
MYESDLVRLIEITIDKKLCETLRTPERRVVHGLEGIARTIGKSTSTAWRMKNEGAFDGYISQIGNSISAYEDDIIQAGKVYFKKKQAERKTVKKPRRINFK